MKEPFLMTEDLLWDYADGLLDEPTATALLAYLQQHPDWQLQLDTIVADRKALLSMPLDKPRADFSSRVMAAWAMEQMTQKVRQPRKDWISYGIAALFGLFILGGIAMIIVALAQNALPETPAVIADYTKKINIDLNRFNIDFNKVMLLLTHPMWQYFLYFGLTFALLHLLDRRLNSVRS
jgi:anti-sigma factor RsiW